MKLPSLVLLGTAITQVLVGGALGLGLGPFPQLGMPGVAAGQLVAASIGAMLLLAGLVRGQAGVTLALATPLSRARFADILRVGAPACLSPLQTIATVLILTRLVAEFGPDALAGYGIGTRLEFLMVPIAFAVGVASVPMVGTALGGQAVARARRVAWTAGAVAALLLGSVGLVLAVGPDLWTRVFTHAPAVRDAATLYFRWVGPTYAIYGVGLCLYFASLGAGQVRGVLLAGTLRLVVVALGGLVLVRTAAPEFAVFALIAIGMIAYGGATALAVWRADWSKPAR
jgi:Na+-driven multidrug efflux pump